MCAKRARLVPGRLGGGLDGCVVRGAWDGFDLRGTVLDLARAYETTQKHNESSRGDRSIFLAGTAVFCSDAAATSICGTELQPSHQAAEVSK